MLSSLLRSQNLSDGAFEGCSDNRGDQSRVMPIMPAGCSMYLLIGRSVCCCLLGCEFAYEFYVRLFLFSGRLSGTFCWTSCFCSVGRLPCFCLRETIALLLFVCQTFFYVFLSRVARVFLLSGILVFRWRMCCML